MHRIVLLNEKHESFFGNGLAAAGVESQEHGPLFFIKLIERFI